MSQEDHHRDREGREEEEEERGGGREEEEEGGWKKRVGVLAASSSSAAFPRDTITRFQPRFASSRPISRPIPLLAPVSTTYSLGPGLQPIAASRLKRQESGLRLVLHCQPPMQAARRFGPEVSRTVPAVRLRVRACE